VGIGAEGIWLGRAFTALSFDLRSAQDESCRLNESLVPLFGGETCDVRCVPARVILDTSPCAVTSCEIDVGGPFDWERNCRYPEGKVARSGCGHTWFRSESPAAIYESIFDENDVVVYRKTDFPEEQSILYGSCEAGTVPPCEAWELPENEDSWTPWSEACTPAVDGMGGSF
jgi:hypothetical protein